MNNDITKDIIIRVNLDTKAVDSDVANVNGKINTIGQNVNLAPFKSLKQELRQATIEAQNIGAKVGLSSKEFITAAKRVSDLKDKIGDANDVIKQFNPDNKLQGVVSVASGAIAAIQGVAGAFTLLGVKAEDANVIIAKLQGLMALGSAIGQIDNIKNAFVGLKAALFGVSTTAKDAAVSTALNTTATTAEGVAAEATTVSFISLRTVLMSLGIGLVIAAVAALVANFDKLQEMLGLTNDKFDAMSEINTKAMENEGMRIATLETLITTVKKGELTQREKNKAVKEYNDNLGETLGKVKNYNELENKLIKDGPKYIEYLMVKAQAEAAYSLILENQKQILLEKQKDPLSYLNPIARLTSGDAKFSGQLKQEDAIDKLNQKTSVLLNNYAELSKRSSELANGLKLPDENKPVKTTDKSTVNSKKQAEKEINDFIKSEYDRMAKERMTQYEKELFDLDNKYKSMLELAKKYNLDVSELEQARTKATADITNNEIVNNRDKWTIEDVNLKAFGVNQTAQMSSISANVTEIQKQTSAELAAAWAEELDNFMTGNRDKISSLEMLGNALENYGRSGKNQTEGQKKTAIVGVRVNEALSVADIAMSSASATMKAYAASPTTFGLPWSAFYIASGIANIAAAHNNANKAVSQIKGSDSSSGSGSSVATAPSAPSLNTTILSTTQEAQNVRVVNQPNQQLIRAYVSQDELTSSQEKQNFLNKLSNF